MIFILFQVLLGLSGVILVMLSVIASVGFFSAIGVKSTLIIMEVIPFLVLAVSFNLLVIPYIGLQIQIIPNLLLQCLTEVKLI